MLSICAIMILLFLSKDYRCWKEAASFFLVRWGEQEIQTHAVGSWKHYPGPVSGTNLIYQEHFPRSRVEIIWTDSRNCGRCPIQHSWACTCFNAVIWPLQSTWPSFGSNPTGEAKVLLLAGLRISFRYSVIYYHCTKQQTCRGGCGSISLFSSPSPSWGKKKSPISLGWVVFHFVTEANIWPEYSIRELLSIHDFLHSLAQNTSDIVYVFIRWKNLKTASFLFSYY